MTESDVNKRQPGGNHYASEYQHWDFIENHGIGYLEAACTKYVCRWRKKGGRMDLEKALHYLDKLMELHDSRYRLPRGVAPPQEVARFCTVNQLPLEEAYIIATLSQWTNSADLISAREAIVRLLARPKDEKRTHGHHTGMLHRFGYDDAGEEVDNEKR